MTKFYKIDTQEILTFQEAKALFPRTGIPNNPDSETVLSFFAASGIIKIAEREKPEDTLGTTWDEGVSYDETTNIARQVWNARDMTPEEMETYLATVKLRYETAVQTHLDAQAQALRFDSIMTAVTYADDMTVARFQIEGSALRSWRSSVWAYVYQALSDVLSGNRPKPTVQELIAELPTFVNPYEE